MFYQLLDNPKAVEPGRLQAEVRRQFVSVVAQSDLKPRKSGCQVPHNGLYVIIGVATYSPEELALLDDVENAYTRWQSTSRVVVFDVMECKTAYDINLFAPPLTMLVQTPVVVVWRDGEPVAAQTGLRMTRELLQKFGILK